MYENKFSIFFFLMIKEHFKIIATCTSFFMVPWKPIEFSPALFYNICLFYYIKWLDQFISTFIYWIFYRNQFRIILYIYYNRFINPGFLIAKFAICTSAILHLVCPQKFALAICLQFRGKTVISRRNDKQRLWKT